MAEAKLTTALVVVFALSAIPVSAMQSEDESEDPAAATVESAREEGLEEVTDLMVVTASRSAQPLHEAPGSHHIGAHVRTARADPRRRLRRLLRNVPGVNVSQMSARDIQITGRAATNSLAPASWCCSTTAPSISTSSAS